MDTRTISVELGDRSYPIIIGRGLLGSDFDLVAHLAGSDCLVVSNTTVAPLYLDRLLTTLDGAAVTSVELPDGEAHKTVATAMRVVDELVNSRANRDTTVIARRFLVSSWLNGNRCIAISLTWSSRPTVAR